MNIFDSPYHDLAGQTLSWLPMDTQSLYIDNLRTNRDLLAKYNWIDAEITYQFNDQGFRSEEFDCSRSILFLGCSFTMGIGLPYEQTWPYLVATDLALKNFNLGIGGGSNDTAFRLGQYWIPKLLPQVVVWLLSYQDRIELLDQTKAHQILGSDLTETPGSDYMKMYVSQNFNGVLNKRKNLLALQQVCHNLKIPLVTIDDVPMGLPVNLEYKDLARDLMHPGVICNQDLSARVLKMISEVL